LPTTRRWSMTRQLMFSSTTPRSREKAARRRVRRAPGSCRCRCLRLCDLHRCSESGVRSS
jgi:hypothetical protein